MYFVPFHIITQSLADDKGILQVFQILVDSIATYLYSTSRLKRIGDFQDIGTKNLSSMYARKTYHSFPIPSGFFKRLRSNTSFR